MIPPALYSGLPAWLWQVTLHSSVAGLVFYLWSRRGHLPSGPVRRGVLALLLVMPLFTAAVPGRTGLEFREELAWLDSARFLSVPIAGGVRVWHAALVFAVASVALTVIQELLPALRRRRGLADAPDELTRRARAFPGWESCRVLLASDPHILLATGGARGARG